MAAERPGSSSAGQRPPHPGQREWRLALGRPAHQGIRERGLAEVCLRVMIPPREQLPKSWQGLRSYDFKLPLLVPNDESLCPVRMREILEYLDVEAPGGSESGSSTVIDFELRFIRTALVNGSRYWLWGLKDEDGTDCYVAVQLRPNGQQVLGYDEGFGLTPEQWLVLEYYGDEEWENEE